MPETTTHDAAAPDATHPLDRACPACGTSPDERCRVVVAEDPWRVVRCAACGFTFLGNTPPPPVATSDHAWSESWQREKSLRASREPVLHGLQAVVRPLRDRLKPDKARAMIVRHLRRGRILDVGCGNGHRLGGCLRAGLIDVVPFGIEIEQRPAMKARALFREFGGEAWIGPARDHLHQLDDDSIDGVYMYAYLEHEPEPRPVLDEVRRMLVPGGPIVIKVPNHGCVNRVVRGRRWCGYRHPDHVNYFTPGTLGGMLEEAGFTDIRCGPGDRMPFNDNMWMTARTPVAD